MVSLLQVSDIEGALERSVISATEEVRWLSYIDAVSDFINNYVDASFELLENHVIRATANWEGVIKLPGYPVHAVLSVTNFRTGNADLYADWDGMDEVFNLEAGQVVDITYTHGYDVVPDDIKRIALFAVLSLIGEGDYAELRSFQVGDVREDYRENFFQSVFGDIGMQTLNKYTDTEYTISTGGSHRYPYYSPQGFINGS